MPCPTCDHTMDMCGVIEDSPVRHCPRCGTLIIHGLATVPKLVERCRKFEIEMAKENIGQYYRNTWHRLGIKESINLPGDRPHA